MKDYENLNQQYNKLGHIFETSESEKSKLLDKFNKQKAEAERLDVLAGEYQSCFKDAENAVSQLKNKIIGMKSDVSILQESRDKLEKSKNLEIENLKIQIADLKKQLENLGNNF